MRSRILTGDSVFPLRVQASLCVDAFLEIRLRKLTEIEIFIGNLAHEFVILFELLPGHLVVVIKLHPRKTRRRVRTDAERGHSAVVQIQRASREEVQKQSILVILWVGEMAGPVVVVFHPVEGRGIEPRESWMGELAVQALLEAVHHGFPVEFPGITQTAAVGHLCEIVAVEQLFEARKEFLE